MKRLSPDLYEQLLALRVAVRTLELKRQHATRGELVYYQTIFEDRAAAEVAVCKAANCSQARVLLEDETPLPGRLPPSLLTVVFDSKGRPTRAFFGTLT